MPKILVLNKYQKHPCIHSYFIVHMVRPLLWPKTATYCWCIVTVDKPKLLNKDNS